MSFLNKLMETFPHKVEAFTRMIERDYAEGTPFFRKFVSLAKKIYPILQKQDFEDVYQNALLSLTCKNSGRYAIENYSYDIDQEKRIDEDRILRKWFIRCLLNKCVDYMRRKKNTFSIDDVDGPDLSLVRDSEENPLEILIRREIKDKVKREYHRLNPIHHQVVRLIYFDGLKYHEAAEKLGIPLGTVKSRLHAAISRLGERLEGLKVA